MDILTNQEIDTLEGYDLDMYVARIIFGMEELERPKIEYHDDINVALNIEENETFVDEDGVCRWFWELTQDENGWCARLARKAGEEPGPAFEAEHESLATAAFRAMLKAVINDPNF
jgi:hypothetical protein